MHKPIIRAIALIALAITVPVSTLSADEVRQVQADEPAPFDGVLLDFETFEAYFDAYQLSQSMSGLLFRLAEDSELTQEELSQFEFQIRRYTDLIALMEEEIQLLEERYTVEQERREEVEGQLRVMTIATAISLGVGAGVLTAVLLGN